MARRRAWQMVESLIVHAGIEENTQSNEIDACLGSAC